MSNTLGTYLRTLRKQHNYTQDMVAQQIGVKRQVYSHYETGRVRPSISLLCKIANLYGIAVRVLLEAIGETLQEEQEMDAMMYQLSREEQDLIRFHRQLNETEQENIIAFAELLAKRKKNT